uniref:ABC transporter domain-containing protein n=1 Tax=Timema bartmani TaxID=61472 RepID=A0A7R9I5Y6_9NEOP|nr:unnamed protein product [Timema bartmani]
MNMMCLFVPAPGVSEEPDDSDVAEERAKIRMGNPDILRKTNDLLLSDVSKFYGSFQAVDQLCVGVKRGECFGLLGVNGAGKTSTFKMLTGDEKISGGEAYVNGLSLKTHMKQAHQIIGYCPQFDALIDNLTGKETLQMYCLLRGIPNSEIPQIINKLADDLLFTKHIDKKVMAYSGGNKRKLSTAVALVGDPPVVYLDEPTTGMDVVAKRHLWNVICQVRDSGKCIVLTSHRFKCLGSPQHLKSKFAEGYTLTIKVNNNSDTDIQAVKEFVRTSLQDAMLREEREGLMTYYIANTTLTWSKMFGMMEEAKTRLSIEDYSLGQTSLEQVRYTFLLLVP